MIKRSYELRILHYVYYTSYLNYPVVTYCSLSIHSVTSKEWEVLNHIPVWVFSKWWLSTTVASFLSETSLFLLFSARAWQRRTPSTITTLHFGALALVLAQVPVALPTIALISSYSAPLKLIGIPRTWTGSITHTLSCRVAVIRKLLFQ